MSDEPATTNNNETILHIVGLIKWVAMGLSFLLICTCFVAGHIFVMDLLCKESARKTAGNLLHNYVLTNELNNLACSLTLDINSWIWLDRQFLAPWH